MEFETVWKRRAKYSHRFRYRKGRTHLAKLNQEIQSIFELSFLSRVSKMLFDDYRVYVAVTFYQGLQERSVKNKTNKQNKVSSIVRLFRVGERKLQKYNSPTRNCVYYTDACISQQEEWHIASVKTINCLLTAANQTDRSEDEIVGSPVGNSARTQRLSRKERRWGMWQKRCF